MTWVGGVLGIRNLGFSRDCRIWRHWELGIYLYIYSLEFELPGVLEWGVSKFGDSPKGGSYYF